MLKSHEKKYLRGLAHSLKPVVMVGRKGVTAAVAESAGQALEDHELIKIRFLDIKGKTEKQALTGELERKTGAECVGLIGHVAIFYKPNPDPEKRKIEFPG